MQELMKGLHLRREKRKIIGKEEKNSGEKISRALI
jgi:hypothetical protein